MLYSINQDLTFEVSYGVTKISIKGFYPGKLGKTALAFYNDLSLKRLLESDQLHKFECQLYGEGQRHQASVYMQIRREGDAMPRYNAFAELANRIQINKELYIAQYPELALTKEDLKKQEEDDKQHEEALPKMSLIEMTKGF